MPDGVILFREKPPASGTWSPRPPALAGITPVAVLVYGIFGVNEIDGVNSAGACFFCGFSDGVVSRGIANYQQDALASAATRVGNMGQGLCHAPDDTTALLLELGNCTLVSGGMDVPVSVNVNLPYVNCAFFYGDDWQAYCDLVRVSGDADGVVTESTGFTGTNENQLIFTLPCLGDQCSTTSQQSSSAVNFGFGVAARQGASTVPVGQSGWGGAPRSGAGTSQLGQSFESAMVHSPARRSDKENSVECTRIDDNEIDFTTRQAIGRRGLYLLVVSTGARKCWAGKIDPLTASGNWIVNDPGFPPSVVGIAVHQGRVSGAFEDDDIAIGGMAVGNSSDEFSAIWSDEDAVGTMVAKSRINSQFLDVLQDNGVDGWKSGPNDFSLTTLGFRVDNVVVGAGAPATQRAWIGWAIEGVAAGGPATLETDDVSHAHPIDTINLIPSTYRVFADDVSHGHLVNEAQVTRPVALSIDDVNHANVRDSVNLIIQVEGVLNVDDLNHDHSLDPSYFGIYLRNQDLDHGHAVGQTVLTTVRGLGIDDILHSHSPDEVNLTGKVEPILLSEDIQHSHSLDLVTLPKTTPLNAEDAVHDHPVSSVDVRTGDSFYPYINPDEGMLVFTWKPRYSKSDMSTPPDTMALVGLVASHDAMFRLFYGDPSALESLDGTSTVRVTFEGGTGPRENISYRCALWWDNQTQRRQIGYKPEDGAWVWGAEGAYDGRFGEGALRTFFNIPYPQLISDIVIYNQNEGVSFIEALPLEF